MRLIEVTQRGYRRDNQNKQHAHFGPLKNNAGFTLIEVMIVVAIIGIIAAIALPSYNDSVTKGRRSDGKSALLNLASAMEKHFYTNKTYTVTIADLGVSTTSTEGYYTLSISAATTACPLTSCYAINATGIGAQTSDGVLTLDSLGQKTPTDKW